MSSMWDRMNLVMEVPSQVTSHIVIGWPGKECIKLMGQVRMIHMPTDRLLQDPRDAQIPRQQVVFWQAGVGQALSQRSSDSLLLSKIFNKLTTEDFHTV
jgi:hypothetical protein